jgi:hypothetical protein
LACACGFTLGHHARPRPLCDGGAWPRRTSKKAIGGRLGAAGIVSKRIDGTYRSGRCPVWIKVRNPASVAVQRERSENWNR